MHYIESICKFFKRASFYLIIVSLLMTNFSYYHGEVAEAAAISFSKYTVATGLTDPQIYVGDQDGDGDEDVFVNYETDSSSFYKWNGSGFDTVTVSSGGTNVGYHNDDFAIADFDGANGEDIFATYLTTDAPFYIEHNGGSSYDSPIAVGSTSDRVGDKVACGQINNDVDSYADCFAIAYFTDNKLHYYLNDGTPSTGYFTKTTYTGYDVGSITTAKINIADFTNDGLNDVLVWEDDAQFFENQGSGSLNRTITMSNSLCNASYGCAYDYRHVTAADISSDDYTDIVYKDEGTSLYWFKNDGTPQVNFGTSYLIGDTGVASRPSWSIENIAVADLDADGDDDVITASPFEWWENDGTPENGGWTNHVIDASVSGWVEAGDFTGDGVDDIILRDGTAVYFYKNPTTLSSNTAPTVNVDNITPVLVSQSTDGLGEVTFDFTVDDAEDDSLDITLDYTINGGTNWYRLYLEDGDVSATDGVPAIISGTYDSTDAQIETVLTTSGANTVTVQWDSKYATDSYTPITTDSDAVQIRITVDDGTETDSATSSTFTVDNQEPSGTIEVQSSSDPDGSHSHTMNLTEDIDLSSVAGADEMRFSNDGVTYTAYEAYATTKSSWDMSDGTYGGDSDEGAKTVYAMFVDEFGNESSPITDNIIFDETEPTNPDGAIDDQGSVDDTWSNTNDDPDFTSFENEYDDNGVYQYYWYFGTDASGVTTDSVLTDAADPDSVADTDTRYLRVIAQDNAGLWADPDGGSSTCTNTNADRPANADCWTTIFTHKYDEDAPNSPSPSVDPSSWTSTNSFDFSWSDPGDTGAGVANYTYETDGGTSPVTTPDETTESVILTSDSEGTKLFEIFATDGAANSSPNGSVNFRLDSSPPVNAGITTDLNGSLDDTWATIANPSFTWVVGTDAVSDVADYDVYWGIESDGTSVTETVSGNAYEPGTTPDPNVSYYLRINTRDDAGNTSGWETKYTFKYSQLPADPPSLTQTTTQDDLSELALTMGEWTGDTTPTLQFTLSDPDGDSLGYIVYVDDNDDFSSPEVHYTYGANDIASGTLQGFTVGQAEDAGGLYTVGAESQTLAPGEYYWKVQAVESHGLTSSEVIANTGSVAFQIETTAPDISALTLASTGTTTSSASVAVSGTPTDSDSGMHATPYRFYNLTEGTDSGWQAGTTWTSSGLTSSSIYIFKVVVRDAAGNTVDSSTVGVTTSAPAVVSSGSSGGGGPTSAEEEEEEEEVEEVEEEEDVEEPVEEIDDEEEEQEQLEDATRPFIVAIEDNITPEPEVEEEAEAEAEAEADEDEDEDEVEVNLEEEISPEEEAVLAEEEEEEEFIEIEMEVVIEKEVVEKALDDFIEDELDIIFQDILLESPETLDKAINDFTEDEKEDLIEKRRDEVKKEKKEKAKETYKVIVEKSQKEYVENTVKVDLLSFFSAPVTKSSEPVRFVQDGQVVEITSDDVDNIEIIVKDGVSEKEYKEKETAAKKEGRKIIIIDSNTNIDNCSSSQCENPDFVADLYQISHGLPLFNPDPDGDGRRNEDEIFLGTNPLIIDEVFEDGGKIKRPDDTDKDEDDEAEDIEKKTFLGTNPVIIDNSLYSGTLGHGGKIKRPDDTDDEEETEYVEDVDEEEIEDVEEEEGVEDVDEEDVEDEDSGPERSSGGSSNWKGSAKITNLDAVSYGKKPALRLAGEPGDKLGIYVVPVDNKTEKIAIGETSIDDEGKGEIVVLNSLDDGEYFVVLAAEDGEIEMVDTLEVEYQEDDQIENLRFIDKDELPTFIDRLLANVERFIDDFDREAFIAIKTPANNVIKGTAEPGSTVYVAFKSVVISSVVISDASQGEFTIEVPKKLALGDHDLTAYVVNERLNTVGSARTVKIRK
jgi:hypothetical protein